MTYALTPDQESQIRELIAVFERAKAVYLERDPEEIYIQQETFPPKPRHMRGRAWESYVSNPVLQMQDALLGIVGVLLNHMPTERISVVRQWMPAVPATWIKGLAIPEMTDMVGGPLGKVTHQTMRDLLTPEGMLQENEPVWDEFTSGVVIIADRIQTLGDLQDILREVGVTHVTNAQLLEIINQVVAARRERLRQLDIDITKHVAPRLNESSEEER